jgi:cholesterol transport system auxiliary component
VSVLGRLSPVKSIAGATALALSLAGCSALGLGSKEAPPAFDLSTPPARPHIGAIRGQLVIPEPTAGSVLDTERIVVRPEPGQVATLGGAQWSERLPRLLQARVLQAFENSGRLRAVGRPGEGIAGDDQLLLDVRAFQLTVMPSPVGEVEIAAKIVDNQSGRIIAGRIFRATRPAAGTDGPQAVAAIDAAFRDVTVQLMRWVTGAI